MADYQRQRAAREGNTIEGYAADTAMAMNGNFGELAFCLLHYGVKRLPHRNNMEIIKMETDL